MKTKNSKKTYTRPTRRVMRALRSFKSSRVSPRSLASKAALTADGLADALKRLVRRKRIVVADGFIAVAA
jgi:hypothetical protein